MEKLQIKNWDDLKRRIKNMFPGIQDNDLNYQQGQEEQLVSTLQQKTGKNREEIVRFINEGEGQTGQSGQGGVGRTSQGSSGVGSTGTGSQSSTSQGSQQKGQSGTSGSQTGSQGK